MHIANYLGLVHVSEQQLAEALLTVAETHHQEPDVLGTCKLLASWSFRHVTELAPFVERYAEKKSKEPKRLRQALFHGPRTGGLGLLRDLHDLWLLASEVHLGWSVLSQAAQALRDEELHVLCQKGDSETRRQQAWLWTRIEQAAPQALVVAS